VQPADSYLPIYLPVKLPWQPNVAKHFISIYCILRKMFGFSPRKHPIHTENKYWFQGIRFQIEQQLLKIADTDEYAMIFNQFPSIFNR
jgi:hypothetical protein